MDAVSDEGNAVKREPMFPSDHDELETSQIESLCMNCHSQGITRLLLVKIPFFRDVVLSSFSCEDCNLSNVDLQSADRIQDNGARYSLNVDPAKDLNRRVVKTDTSTIKIPEIELEIPPESQKGTLTTIEGIFERTIAGLEQEQPVRRIMDPENAKKIDGFVAKLRSLLTRAKPFKFIMDDPTGNCFIENFHAPNPDPQMTVTFYERTKAQDEALGIAEEEKTGDAPAPDEVLQFQSNCSNCNAPVTTNMKMVDIPHFKQIILMAMSCDACGEKSNEVKSGTGFEPKGKKMTLNVTDSSDLNRDVLKSETCSVSIPEIEMEIGGHSIAGKFTTIEGLLNDIKDLVLKNPFTSGDSTANDIKVGVDKFSEKIDGLLSGDVPFTYIMDDPAGNSYLQNVYAPEDDPEMVVEYYERSFEQNEDLGLNDMKTDDYNEN